MGGQGAVLRIPNFHFRKANVGGGGPTYWGGSHLKHNAHKEESSNALFGTIVVPDKTLKPKIRNPKP